MDSVNQGSSTQDSNGNLLNSNNQNNVPKISIVIPVYNQVDYTKQCIEAVWETGKNQNYEIIVIDDCSTDGTDEYLQSVKVKVRSFRNQKNQGFILNCNFAASVALGDYIVLLNNDTIPQENWLEGMLEPFQLYEKVAATGALMIHPDNKILEASSIVFSDGSGWNYGRGNSPDFSRYNFIREVDYVSGGGMMIPKKIWDELGGLDTYYCPAYYDDIDFCFKARKAGYKILYTSFSRIIHFEGMTGGTDTTKGVKRFQVINREKFRQRWKDELKNQYENKFENVFRASRREKGKRILWVDHCLPLPNFNSGCLRMNNLLKSFVKLGHMITYITLSSYDPDNYADVMRKMGVETAGLNFESWQFADNEKKYVIVEHILNSMEVHSNNYDVVYLSFYWVAMPFIKSIRKRLPSAIIYVDSHDIHFLRTQREAELFKDVNHIVKAKQTYIEELGVYNRADAVMTVTELDKQAVQKELPNKPIFLMPNVHDVVLTEFDFNVRKDLLFVGGFNHTPNVDSMLYFCKDIFPKVEAKIPGIKLWIVGSNPTPEVKALEKESVIVTGWVNDTKPYLDRCKISIAPLRYGAGMKGKVGEAMCHGLPVITTSVGSEGMGVVNGEHAIVVEEVDEWVEQINLLYHDEMLWKKLSSNGQSLMDKQYGSGEMIKRSEYILGFNSREEVGNQSQNPLRSTRQNTDLSVTIIIVAYNQVEYTKQCIDSLKKYTHIPYRIIVIDNYSKDKTRNYLNSLTGIEIVANQTNLGFPAACNQGLTRSYDEYVLLLNNDVIVTEGWLERLIEVAESDSKIGMVGPISNIVSGLQLDSEATYGSLVEMHSYAQTIRNKNKGKILHFPRIAFLCTLIKKELVDKIGGLDERFSPGNYEDDDFCLRAQFAGYKTVIAKDVFIHHFGSKSFKADGEKKYAERIEINKQKFVNKWNVTPEELWLQNKTIKERQYNYPINKHKLIQFYDRFKIHIADNELDLALGALESANQSYKSFVGNPPIFKPDLLNLLGNICLALGKTSAAKKYFEDELVVDQYSSAAYLGLGEVHQLNKKFESAKKMFEQAVKMNHQNSNAMSKLREVNKILGIDENDNKFIEKISSEEACKISSNYYYKQEYKMAIEILKYYETFLQPKLQNENKYEDIAAIMNIHGFCYLGLEMYDTAKSFFENAMKANPSSSQACVGLGELFFLDEQYDNAKTMFEWAVKNDESNKIAVESLTKVNSVLGLEPIHNTLYREE